MDFFFSLVRGGIWKNVLFVNKNFNILNMIMIGLLNNFCFYIFVFYLERIVVFGLLVIVFDENMSLF